MLAIGTAFLVPSGPAEYLHLNIVGTAQIEPPDMRLLIPISSIKDGVFHDQTCVLDVGEHPFITKPSFVFYRHIQQRSATKISMCLENGDFIAKDSASEALIAKIIAGIPASNFTAPWVLNFFQN
ncbi:hypothetical protein [Sulfitobacter sp.]|uniref:hypothetical protein n=1 Tax=Sulfitobacter sp. TaxID=1903071 RepID=UPI0035657E98